MICSQTGSRNDDKKVGSEDDDHRGVGEASGRGEFACVATLPRACARFRADESRGFCVRPVIVVKYSERKVQRKRYGGCTGIRLLANT